MNFKNLIKVVAIFVIVAMSVPATAQISVGGSLYSETEKHPIAMNLVMAVHIVSAPDWAYRSGDADRLLAAPLAAVASSAMGGPAGKPANAPAYFRITPQGVKNLISLELSFNGVDFISTQDMGPEDGFVGVVPKLRPGLYTPVARITHKDGRKDVTILFFIRSGKSVEGQATAAFQLLVTNPVSGIERMSTREIAGLCMNTIPADGPGVASAPAAVTSVAPVQALPVPTVEEPSIDFAPPVVETPRQEVAREGTLIVRFIGREPANGWPEVKILGPEGEHYFRVPQGQSEMRVPVPAGEYQLAGISQYGWVLDGPFSQRLGVGGSTVFEIRPKEGR